MKNNRNGPENEFIRSLRTNTGDPPKLRNDRDGLITIKLIYRKIGERIEPPGRGMSG